MEGRIDGWMDGLGLNNSFSNTNICRTNTFSTATTNGSRSCRNDSGFAGSLAFRFWTLDWFICYTWSLGCCSLKYNQEQISNRNCACINIKNTVVQRLDNKSLLVRDVIPAILDDSTGLSLQFFLLYPILVLKSIFLMTLIRQGTRHGHGTATLRNSINN